LAERRRAKLVLKDGRVFEGWSFGAPGEAGGEVVFNTSMTGYQEIVTDPSYAGQIVTMTYPLIGNYGVNPDDVESRGPQVAGFVVREASRLRSNFRSTGHLGQWLRDSGVVAIEGVDTRAVTRHVRLEGAMNGVISTGDLDDKSLAEKARALPDMNGLDLVKAVTTPKIFHWSRAFHTPYSPRASLADVNRAVREAATAHAGGRALQRELPWDEPVAESRTTHRVVAIDYGMKWNILRNLTDRGADVTVVPASTKAAEVLGMSPDGVFLSNGPGDPRPVTYGIQTVSGLVGRTPVFGICLGHQLLGLALGGTIYKLKFGHRGANHPVRNERTGRIEITSQNHGFALKADGLPDNVEITHVNLNDHTVEGLAHRDAPAFSVQYHPEASPGPHDASYLFDQFFTMMNEAR
jgi:carbamoyl-phosphate synthase small subunit